jgi:hydroxyacylglutathione hydrolase
MYHSLQILAHLPDTTQVYCAHEYTLANLRFAQSVEPENSAIPESIAAAQALRQHNRPTVPSTLAREKRTNPFLRSHLQEIKDRVAQRCGESIDTDVECFAQLRHWKDQF